MTTFFLNLLGTFAYISYDDVKRIPSLNDQTVIVIKAPAETRLEVPDPAEVHTHTHTDHGQCSLYYLQLAIELLKY